MNKNISVWRGHSTPPTNYHLWVNDNKEVKIFIDGQWQSLTSADLSKIEKTLNDVKNEQKEINDELQNTIKGVQINDQLLQVDENGIAVGSIQTNYELPTASIHTMGGVKIGSFICINDEGGISPSYDGVTITGSQNALSVGAFIQLTPEYTLDDCVEYGIYNLNQTIDNPILYKLPILNGGNIIGRLSVFTSENSISQVLQLFNVAGGDTNIYTRTKLPSGEWKPWGKLQSNIEVGVINEQQLDGLIDNGIYSGIYFDGNDLTTSSKLETFVLITINNHLISDKLQVGQSISQLIYSVSIDQSITIKTRTRNSTGFWTEWDNINSGNAIDTSILVGLKQETSGEIFNDYTNNKASWYSHAEGLETTALGSAVHAEGNRTQASGYYTHAEGIATKTSGWGSHAEGYNTQALSNYSHAEGYGTTASQDECNHAEGYYTKALGTYSHAEGYATETKKAGSHAEGYITRASGHSSHAEGYQTAALGNYSHSEGQISQATGQASHAEGYNTAAEGIGSHSEGYQTTAKGAADHAEGHATTAQGVYSHAEGYFSKALGSYTHAQGYYTQAKGNGSHSGGRYTNAIGAYSFAHGDNLSAYDYQTVFGRYNKSNENAAFIIGGPVWLGTTAQVRNIMELDWDGNLTITGTINGVDVQNIGSSESFVEESSLTLLNKNVVIDNTLVMLQPASVYKETLIL